ncbi:MAG: hypothetical protein CM1200mP9_06770 [Gammaproteobacteria bacterium]|nr:MAG: hypothetical protein CM1200mP9_06770 [Gammaproteobacteria bacterium]
MGIAGSLIRISVGIEEVEDLIEDFRTALEIDVWGRGPR